MYSYRLDQGLAQGICLACISYEQALDICKKYILNSPDPELRRAYIFYDSCGQKTELASLSFDEREMQLRTYERVGSAQFPSEIYKIEGAQFFTGQDDD